ncbi:MAG TPA: DUF5947 family protein [Acidimicrobiales bacterium]|nr:DUF5947 family protein [Acidimicrobiales bacterium]
MTSGLARYLAAPRTGAPTPVERCELCGVTVPDAHRHLVDLDRRDLLCACQACALLFSDPGAGRYRLIPDRVRSAADAALTDAEWEDLQIPVGMAFFFRHSTLGRWAAFYPSPAGATESVLALDAWRAVVDRSPTLSALTPDTEALLVRRTRDRSDSYVVPIDTCYLLVGLVRTLWRGFDGGREVHDAIDSFFAGLDRRATEAA